MPDRSMIEPPVPDPAELANKTIPELARKLLRELPGPALTTDSLDDDLGRNAPVVMRVMDTGSLQEVEPILEALRNKGLDIDTRYSVVFPPDTMSARLGYRRPHRQYGVSPEAAAQLLDGADLDKNQPFYRQEERKVAALSGQNAPRTYQAPDAELEEALAAIRIIRAHAEAEDTRLSPMPDGPDHYYRILGLPEETRITATVITPGDENDRMLRAAHTEALTVRREEPVRAKLDQAYRILRYAPAARLEHNHRLDAMAGERTEGAPSQRDNA